MIKHIVMWKLKDTAEGSTKIENAKKIKNDLELLKGVIAELYSIEVGIDINKSEAAYDLVLYSEFKDQKSLDIYQNHPEHLKVAGFVKKVSENRIVVDYEI
ncbi:stress responsive A/B barrel domain protein [Clostridium acetireducens DSM 10703]|jgi:hypothetical protein|uniref:Stress responsive A/B barrel domain protein n=1 Tax=Clostridium acetireducens DSM 10703 TaxID=1121290 RepID=A0A1E8EY14_9CLOT|nr:Dabb family protein [Clostridium acetireducens]OFI05836.1 stress responsive A/B barrel domain protein [Clostridium acetireducens DSM 10703]